MSDFLKNLPGPIGIVGMGLSGQSVQNLLTLVAPEKKVITFDSSPGLADRNNLDEMLAKVTFSTLIVSPGVPLRTPALLRAQKQGTQITSELALASSMLTQEKLIAVTGSIGKSTTVALLEVACRAIDP